MRADKLALLGLAVGLAACDGCGQKTPVATGGMIAPLQTPAPTMALAVAGFGDAVVSVPAGATRALPVVVAVLGIGDTPEEQCEAWRDVVGSRAFVLCPRGAKHFISDEEDAGTGEPPPPAKKDFQPEVASAAASSDEGTSGDVPSGLPTASATASAPPIVAAPPASQLPKPATDAGGVHQVGFYPVDAQTLDKEVTAGLAALKSRFALYIDDRSLVYAGFSRGAFLGPSLMEKHPDKFGRAILIEGGQSAWTQESAAKFAKAGGKRVLFACGQPSCVDESEPIAQLLRNEKMDAKVVIGQGEGHGYKKQVKDQLKKHFDWVVEGDPAWATK